jgi:hypothetical protein
LLTIICEAQVTGSRIRIIGEGAIMKKIIFACAIFMSPAVALGADLPG